MVGFTKRLMNSITVGLGLAVIVAVVMFYSQRPAAHGVERKPTRQIDGVAAEIASAREEPGIPMVAPDASLKGRVPAVEAKPAVPAIWVAHTNSTQDIDFIPPMADWKDAGMDTAQATLETYMWAAANGDVEKLSTMIDIVGKMQRDSTFHGLSPESRAKFGTPEKLAALMVASDAGTFLALEKSFINWTSPISVCVSAHFTRHDGSTVVDIFWIYQTPAGFRIGIMDTKLAAFVHGDPSRGPYRVRK